MEEVAGNMLRKRTPKIKGCRIKVEVNVLNIFGFSFPVSKILTHVNWVRVSWRSRAALSCHFVGVLTRPFGWKSLPRALTWLSCLSG